MTVTLYHGDCLEILPILEVRSVDAIITDPPFGTGKLTTHGSSYKVKPTRDKFQWDKWDCEWFSLLDSKCKAVFVPPAKLPELLVNNRLLCAVTRMGVCAKNISPMFRTQPIVLFGKTPVNYTMDWCEYKITGEKRFHPTQKSLTIMRWLVEMCTEPEGLIVDPFMGGGTTGIACIQTGRNFIGIEIDRGYFEIAERRIKEAQMQPPLFTFAQADNHQGIQMPLDKEDGFRV